MPTTIRPSASRVLTLLNEPVHLRPPELNAAIQKQPAAALASFFHDLTHLPPPELADVVRANANRHLPVVMSRAEVARSSRARGIRGFHARWWSVLGSATHLGASRGVWLGC